MIASFSTGGVLVGGIVALLLNIGLAVNNAAGDVSTGEGSEEAETEVEQPWPRPFVVKPYLQLGNNPQCVNPEQLEVLWLTDPIDAKWRVQVKPQEKENWVEVESVSWTSVVVEWIPAHRVYRAKLEGLTPGSLFEYRVVKDDRIVFTASGRARRHPGESYRCVVMGDCGVNSTPQKEIAYRMHQAKPDFVVIHGDIVYYYGRISEYLLHYFPIYNRDESSPRTGAPLMRSTLFFGGLGEHDTGESLDVYPDGFAYYMYWSQPLNGPPMVLGDSNAFPLGGTKTQQQAILAVTQDRYPRMANYSFDYGNTHWVVLDSWNPHIDWNDSKLRHWLREDLAAAKNATWKFVGCYLPPFNSSTAFPHSQKMRVIVDILQEAGVDIVFSGYTHAYQRCFPLRFNATPSPTGPVKAPGREIPGEFQLDRQFDGIRDTTPEGIIYLVTGAAGNVGLHSPEQTNAPETWKDFTHTYIADIHSFTLLDVNDEKVEVQQIDKTGRVIDQFAITKKGK